MISPTRPAPPDYVGAGVWPGRTLPSYLDEAVRERPGGLAVVDGPNRLTYGQFATRVHAVARGLIGLGGAQGDVVTVDLPNWWEASVAVQATLRNGSVVNPVVPIYRDQEISFILRQAGSAVVVVPHRFRGFDYVEMLQRIFAGLEQVPRVVVVRPEGSLPRGFVPFEELLKDTGSSDARGEPDDVCLLLYTSGTTADPKGVLHSHQTLAYENRSIIDLFHLTDADTVFMASPVTHITGYLYGVLMPPMLGTGVVFLDIWDPHLAARLIEGERCRFTVGATPFLEGLCDAYDQLGCPSALRVFPCGGADVPPELVRRATRVLDAPVMRIYGSSEFPTFSCAHLEDDLDVAAETDGFPIGAAEGILDQMNPEGVGELLVRGPDTFLGYLDSSLNLEAFTPDGFFRTGDLASLDERGAITIRGRKKDIIIRNGVNISAKEVEDLLYEHPEITDVAVVAMPDPHTGEKGCAFIVTTPGAVVTLEDVRRFLDDRHIARQKIPEHLETVSELPRTASGKVQKFLLRERLLLREPSSQ